MILTIATTLLRCRRSGRGSSSPQEDGSPKEQREQTLRSSSLQLPRFRPLAGTSPSRGSLAPFRYGGAPTVSITRAVPASARRSCARRDAFPLAARRGLMARRPWLLSCFDFAAVSRQN